MDIPEKVQVAVNEMFLCRDMFEHVGCFHQYYEELKDWTFIIFSDEEGAKLPDILCTNLDNDFAVINLECGEKYYAIHVLLTFDNGLKDVLQINPLEKLAIYDGIAIPKLKYLWWENIEGPKEKIFGKEYKLMRKQALAKRNLEELQRNLETELKELCC